MRGRLGVAALLALAVLGTGAATAPADDDHAAARPVILAAASLTEVLPRIVPEAAYSFGSSNSLAEQIRRGAPFDVYLSASPVYAQALFREELTRKPLAFATNSLVVIVPRSNPARIKTVFDPKWLLNPSKVFPLDGRKAGQEAA